MANEKYIKLSDAKDEFYYALSDHDTAIVDYKDADAILDGVDTADVVSWQFLKQYANGKRVNFASDFVLEAERAYKEAHEDG